MKIKINQRKKDGGAINFSIRRITFVFIFFLIIIKSFPINASKKKSIYLIRDPEIEYFIQHLLNEILIIKKQEINSISPRILLDNSINAFVIGNNKIYINTGLIQNAKSIEEIQGVISHELGHLFLGHIQSRKNYNKYSSNSFALGALTLLGISLTNSSTDLSGLILASKDLVMKNKSKYNRQQEMEADIYAIKTLNKMNVSLKGLKQFFEKINVKNKILVNPLLDYYNTHPSPDNRIELINNFSSGSKSKLNTSISLKNFKLNLEFLKIKTLLFSQNTKYLNSIKNYEDEIIQKYLEMSKFYLQGDIPNALIKINLIKLDQPSNPFIFHFAGDMYFEIDKIDQAISHYKNSIDLTIKNKIQNNSLIKLSLAKALIKRNDKNSLKKGFNILEEIIPHEGSSTLLWRLIAECSGKLGEKSTAYVALAEEQLIKNNFKKAKQFAKLGLKDKNLNFTYKLRAQDIMNLKKQR